MEEMWKDIVHYPGYQVSSQGRVRTHNKTTSSARFKTRKWKDRILSQKYNPKDRCSRVELWANGQHKTYLVHRLVAEAFLGKPPDENMTVNHKDGNRQNNCVENLEWMTVGDNVRHGFDHLWMHQTPCTLIAEDGTRHEFRSLSQGSLFLGKGKGYLSLCKQKDLAVYDCNSIKYRLICAR